MADDKPKRITKKQKLLDAAWEPPSPDNYRCQECGLSKTCKSAFLKPSGPLKPILMIVGPAPGEEDDKHNKQFISPTGKLMKHILKAEGMTPKDVAFMSAVRCRPPTGKPTAKQVDMCSPFVLQQIAEYRPGAVLCVGSDAARAVLQMNEAAIKDLTVKCHRATIRDITDNDPQACTEGEVYVTYSPGAALLGNAGILQLIQRHVRVALRGIQPVEFPPLSVVGEIDGEIVDSGNNDAGGGHDGGDSINGDDTQQTFCDMSADDADGPAGNAA